MPVKSGLDAMTEILEMYPELKVIIISADDSIREKALESGAVAFISKPINSSSLKTCLMNLCNRYGSN
jgi:YesN/AraC family two-component response regulator